MLRSVIAAVILAPGLLLAQEKPAAPAASPAAPAAPAAAPAPTPELPKPAPELAKLQFMVGDWVHDEMYQPGPMGPGCSPRSCSGLRTTRWIPFPATPSTRRRRAG